MSTDTENSTVVAVSPAPAPESSKQGAKKVLGGTWRASKPRRRSRRVRGAKGAEDRDAEGIFR